MKVVSVKPPTRPKTPSTEGEITVTLTYAEAIAVAAILSNVSGLPASTPRRYTDEVNNALQCYVGGDVMGMVEPRLGSLRFADGAEDRIAGAVKQLTVEE